MNRPSFTTVAHPAPTRQALRAASASRTFARAALLPTLALALAAVYALAQRTSPGARG